MGRRSWMWLGSAVALPIIGWSVSGIAEDFPWLHYAALPLGIGLGAICLIGLLIDYLRSRRPKPSAEPSLPGGYTLKPDTGVIEALNFAATGEWGHTSGVQGLVAFGKALQDFHQLAADGHIRVWYKGFADAPWQFMERDGWNHSRLDISDIVNDRVVVRRRRDGADVGTSALAVSREQWEAAWDYYRSRLA
jgi:hypothetical protein